MRFGCTGSRQIGGLVQGGVCVLSRCTASASVPRVTWRRSRFCTADYGPYGFIERFDPDFTVRPWAGFEGWILAGLPLVYFWQGRGWSCRGRMLEGKEGSRRVGWQGSDTPRVMRNRWEVQGGVVRDKGPSAGHEGGASLVGSECPDRQPQPCSSRSCSDLCGKRCRPLLALPNYVNKMFAAFLKQLTCACCPFQCCPHRLPSSPLFNSPAAQHHRSPGQEVLLQASGLHACVPAAFDHFWGPTPFPSIPCLPRLAFQACPSNPPPARTLIHPTELVRAGSSQRSGSGTWFSWPAP